MQFVKELQVKYVKRRVPDKTLPEGPINEPDDAGQLFIHLLGNEPVERAAILLMDAGNMPLGFRQVGQGGVTTAPLPVGEVVKAALLANAVGVVIAHNHPSGKLEASREDKEVNGKIREALDLVGVTLLDFIIVNESEHKSLMHGS